MVSVRKGGEAMNQLQYPVAPGYRQRDTSMDAAAQVTKVGDMHEMILSALFMNPMIDYELASHFGVPLAKVQPRRSELAAQGKIVDSGVRRKTPANRSAIVWRLP